MGKQSSYARHHLKRVKGKPQFEYHQQSVEHISRKLGELPLEEELNHNASISTEANRSGQTIGHFNRDLERLNQALICKLRAVLVQPG